MRVIAWNNGEHNTTGAGYGLKISKIDRDKIFNKAWKHICLSLPGINKEILINIDKKSFWNGSCRELISKDIGMWLIIRKLAPWPKGKPPTFSLRQKQGNHFELIS